MKKYFLPVLIFTATLIACNNNDKKTEEPSSGLMDATRNFIDAALKGKFDEAKKYMLVDSANVQYLTIAEGFYTTLSAEEKEKYTNASIIIESKEDIIKDSIAVVIYKNSYKNNLDTLRIMRLNNQWLVDLKYLYEHDYDTLMQHIRKDTLK
jgi:Domain of unknown function (DUF4878)